MNAQTQRLFFDGPAGRIEALRDEPSASPAQGVAIICHPHPLFGGTMDNKVVQTLARAHVQARWSTIRFNFRGVGATDGVHDEGRGEAEDLRAIIRAAVPAGSPIAIAGFSFGSFVASQVIAEVAASHALHSIVFVGTAAARFAVQPIAPELHNRSLVIHGDADDTVPLEAVMNWARPQSLPVTVVPGGGHFFHGQLPLLKSLVLRHITSSTLHSL
jgi:uncharacterized protein